MRRNIASLIVSAVLTALSGAGAAEPVGAGAAEPVGAVSSGNLMELVQKAGAFWASADEQTGNQAGMLLAAGLMAPQLAALDTQRPLTCQVYFSDSALQPVLFGTLREGVNPVEIPFLPGQTLIPHAGKDKSVIYCGKNFFSTAEKLTGREVAMPEGDLSAVYFFRDTPWNRNTEESEDDIAKLISSALHKMDVALSFPGRDLLKISAGLEARKNSSLFGFSNAARPKLKEKVKSLPNAGAYIYAEIPKDETFSSGLGILLSRISPECSRADHIYGQFAGNVISGEHDTAILISDGETCRTISGLLPAGTPSRKKFESFLRENCEQFEPDIRVFRGGEGEDIYAKFDGDVITLLAMNQQGYGELVVPIYKSLKNEAPALGGRDFLSCTSRRQDGTYERIGTGSMSNGKFRLNLSFRPEDIRKTAKSANINGSTILP